MEILEVIRIEGSLSHVVEVAVNLADCLDCVETVELEGASVEGRGEVVVAGEILLLDLEISRTT